MNKQGIFLVLCVEFLSWNLSFASQSVTNVLSHPQTFIGREQLLDLIHTRLQRDSLICLSGFGGFGKTVTAEKYCEKFGSSYQVIWWLYGDQDLSEQLKDLAETLVERFPRYAPRTSDYYKNATRFVFKTLEALPVSWLLIFDNVQNPGYVRHFCPQNKTGHAGHILVTTRSHLGWKDPIRLSPLSPQEAGQLLHVLLERNSKSLERLAALFKGYPLAIAQAASFIKSHPTMDTGRYLHLFLHDRPKLIQREEAFMTRESYALNGYNATIHQTIALSLDTLRQESMAGVELLKAVSFLWSQHIPLFLLNQYLQDHFPHMDFDEGVQALCKYAFVDYDPVRKKFAIHDLIQEYIQLQLSSAEKKEILGYLIQTLLLHFQKPRSQIVEFLVQHPLILAHTQKIKKLCQEIGCESEDLLEIQLKELEFTLSGRRDYTRGRSLIEDLEPQVQKASPALQALFYTNQTNYYMWRSDLQKAIQAGQKALSVIDKQRSEEDYLRLLVYLAYVYRNHGDLKNAQTHLDLIVETKADFTKDPYIASIYAYVESGIEYDRGNFQRALQKIEKCLKLSRDHKFSFKSYYHREILHFLILNKLGRYQESLDAAKEFEKRLRTISVSPDHETYARLLLAQAQAYFHLQQISLAETHLQRAEKIFNAWYEHEGTHRKQAYVQKLRGDIWKAKQKPEQALSCYQKAAHFYEKLFVAETIDEVSELYADITLLALQLKDEQTANTFLKKHVHLFGLDHPRTQKIFQHFDEMGTVLPL